MPDPVHATLFALIAHNRRQLAVGRCGTKIIHEDLEVIGTTFSSLQNHRKLGWDKSSRRECRTRYKTPSHIAHICTRKITDGIYRIGLSCRILS